MKKKDVAKKIDMLPFFRKEASKGNNPFSIITHINGRRIPDITEKEERKVMRSIEKKGHYEMPAKRKREIFKAWAKADPTHPDASAWRAAARANKATHMGEYKKFKKALSE